MKDVDRHNDRGSKPSALMLDTRSSCSQDACNRASRDERAEHRCNYHRPHRREMVANYLDVEPPTVAVSSSQSDLVEQGPESARGGIRTRTLREEPRGLSPRGTLTTGADQARQVPFCRRFREFQRLFVTASAVACEAVSGSSRLFRDYSSRPRPGGGTDPASEILGATAPLQGLWMVKHEGRGTVAASASDRFPPFRRAERPGTSDRLPERRSRRGAVAREAYRWSSSVAPHAR